MMKIKTTFCKSAAKIAVVAMSSFMVACAVTGMHQHSELGLSFPKSQMFSLEKTLEETSGLAQHDGLMWTHNDSGDKPRIYAIDEVGKILKTVNIKDGHHFDWEEMAHDDKHLYVADIGDNFAQRDELYLYRISWKDLAKAGDNGSVSAHKMTITVSGKPKTVADKNVHNFDFEGLSSVGDDLWLFSKNRQDGQTSLYRLDKSKSTQRVTPAASYPVDMLVTAADFDAKRNEFALLGYQLGWNGMSSFLWRAKRSVDGKSLDWSSAQRYDIEPDGQWEALVWDEKKSGLLWLSREGNQQGGVALTKTQF
ncbi:hypothetical protein [uncultured Pseudoteredinibacter sp.]|uniref:hypothetical protein n=1 Tax=uncultured Pseudoteredinibacter sp. TaxID=1641701 RepID=UPI0026021056|nr:hypothetical protein [uncultured Pseudoteredinibacter sp.]